MLKHIADNEIKSGEEEDEENGENTETLSVDYNVQINNSMVAADF